MPFTPFSSIPSRYDIGELSYTNTVLEVESSSYMDVPYEITKQVVQHNDQWELTFNEDYDDDGDLDDEPSEEVKYTKLLCL